MWWRRIQSGGGGGGGGGDGWQETKEEIGRKGKVKEESVTKRRRGRIERGGLEEHEMGGRKLRRKLEFTILEKTPRTPSIDHISA